MTTVGAGSRASPASHDEATIVASIAIFPRPVRRLYGIPRQLAPLLQAALEAIRPSVASLVIPAVGDRAQAGVIGPDAMRLVRAARLTLAERAVSAHPGGTVRSMNRESRMVYSTADGDLRKARDPALKQRQADGGTVKVRREVAGRRGKGVTTISGVPVDDAALKELAGRMKKRCGVGGSVKNGVIEIQGDHRDIVVEILRADGYKPVLAGG